MGCLSFMCKESGLPVASDSFSGDAVRMFLLKGGKVIEEMVGHYDSYGQVFKKDKKTSFEWETDWDKVVELMFNNKRGDGIAVVLEAHWKDRIPTTQSEQDPDQGWGERNGKGVRIKEPYHKVYI